IFRTAARRSFSLPLSSGSSRVFTTRSICVRSESVGAPAHASRASRRLTTSATANTPRRRTRIIRTSLALHLSEDVLGDQVFEVDRRLDLPDAAVGGDELFRASRADPDVLLPDQTLGLDRGDRVVLELHVAVQPEHHAGLIVGEPDRLDAAD